MQQIIFLLILSICVVFESTLTTFPLTLIFITLLSIYFKRMAIVWAFVSGIVLDLFLLRTLGFDSIFFLIVVWVVHRYRKKIFMENIIYPFLFAGIICSLYGYLMYRAIRPWQIIFSMVITIIVIILITRFFPYLGEDRNKLRV
jgi:rod shape-determining protein MreD